MSKIPTKDIDYYMQKDGKVENSDKMAEFLEWCKNEGVIMPKL